MAKTPAWQRKEGKSKSGGLNAKGVASYRADNRFIKSKLNWKPKINFKIGITEMLKDINKWKKAPLWTKQNIKLATKDWFKYLN